MVYANGNKYEGDWQDNKKHGSGTMIYASGNKYEGEWKYNIKHGNGVMVYANGNKYEGYWDKNRKHGNGVMVYANGAQYKGEWDKNRKHGNGIMVYTNGNKYEGYWDKNQKHGEGCMYYANPVNNIQTISSGKWLHDTLNGRCQVILTDGTITDRVWMFGKLVSADCYINLTETNSEPSAPTIENEILPTAEAKGEC